MTISLRLLTIGISSLIAAFSFLPLTALADDGVDRATEHFRDEATLYTITFPISASKHDVLLPAILRRDAKNGDRDGVIGYSLEMQGEDPDRRPLAGGTILARGAERMGDEYRVKAGTSARFTVMVIAAANEANGGMYRLRLNEIPFVILRNNVREEQHFNTIELRNFKTNYREINYEREED